MELAFWISAIWVAYVFAGYPVLSYLMARLLDKPVRADEVLPTVTVVTAAYNEAEHIVGTVLNKLDQDYPSDKLRVVVVSDESDDGTDKLVQGIESDRVHLLRQSPRQGKTAALNLAMREVDSEIVIFSDANSRYEPGAIRQLVRNFADESVGYVTGKMIYAAPDGSIVGDGCSAYMRFENWMRGNETRMGSVVGVDGGIDAARTSLYDRMNADQLPDFVLPLKVRKAGYRVIYEPEARLVEDALAGSDSEFRMRVRVSLRALWALKDMGALLNPLRYGLFSLQLWSHKVLRYLAVVPLVFLLVTSAALATTHWVYLAGFVAQLIFYAVAASAAAMREPFLIQKLPWYFTLVNLASGMALWKFLRGQKQVIWQPRVGA